jgi:hypothetical protein
VKPKFRDTLLAVSAIEGSEIILECRATGRPMPNIVWYKDGLKLLMENRMLSYTDRKGVARLNIMHVTSQDAGEYSCEAVSKLGKDFTHCTVRVVGMKPIFCS